MKSRLILVLLALLALGPSLAHAQAAAGSDSVIVSEPEMTYDDYTVKAYTISVFGGWFSGAEYLNLPVRGALTYVTPGSDDILGFNNENLVYDRDIYDGPIKKLESGNSFGFSLSTWLSDKFHIDLVVSYATSQAVLTMVNKNPDDPEHPFREEIDRDPSVKVYRAGLALNYQLDSFKVLGITPTAGFGFGGVINRFTAIKDRGNLYFEGVLNLKRPVTSNLALFAELDATTFAMSRAELQYTQRVTFYDLRAGLSYYVDVLPPGIRALHNEELKKPKKRR